MANTSPSESELLWIYERMYRSRVFENRIEEEYMVGKAPVFNMAKGPIPGEMHLSKGQEPCSAGVCVHMDERDFVSGSHRAHNAAVAKGVDLKAMTAEIFGRSTGLSRGFGGHMHLFDEAARFCCSGIVGQGIGIAAGQALVAQQEGRGGVAVAFTGEGAANQGIFHETLNLAALWKLPFICVIEDNQWGVSVSKARSTAIARNSDRAQSYGIKGYYVEDNDVLAVYQVAKEAISRARQGEGPSIIEIETVRMKGHFLPDAEGYIPKEEIASRKDPIPLFRERLCGEFGFAPGVLDELEANIDREVEEAIVFAKESDEPAPEEALCHVFA